MLFIVLGSWDRAKHNMMMIAQLRSRKFLWNSQRRGSSHKTFGTDTAALRCEAATGHVPSSTAAAAAGSQRRVLYRMQFAAFLQSPRNWVFSSLPIALTVGLLNLPSTKEEKHCPLLNS